MIKYALLNLLRRKTRTVISMIGIIIGVMAIVIMVALADGQFRDMQNAVGQVQGITVFAAGGMGPLNSTLDIDYANKIESIQGVKTAIPTIGAMAKSVEGNPADLGGGFGFTRIIGTDYSKSGASTAAGIGGEIVKGRTLTSSDKGNVVVGEELMKSENKFLNNTIKINGEKFRIVGIYKTGSNLLNSSVLMTLSDAQDLLNYDSDTVSQFSVELYDPTMDQRVAKLIELKYGDDLSANAASGMAEQFNAILDSFRLIVIAIGGISGLVAGIGILNTMLMSVVERFKEIGALKAIGWTSGNVMKMILYESIAMGAIGGLIGIALGIAGAYYISAFAGLKIFIGTDLLLNVFLFAVFVGLFSGLYPAYLASKMDPIEALRVE